METNFLSAPPAKRIDERVIPSLVFAFYSFSKNCPHASQSVESASFCYTWVIPVHFPLTTNSV
jgi:hypothetical protein